MSLTLLLLRGVGMGGGSEIIIVPPQSTGLQYKLNKLKIHYKIPQNKLHYKIKDGC